MLYGLFKEQLAVFDIDEDQDPVWDEFHVVVENRQLQRFMPIARIEFDEKNMLVILHV